MSFDGLKNLMSFDGPLISCLLMDPTGPSKDMSAEKLLSNTYNRVVTARAFIVGCMNLQCRAVILYFIGTIKGTTSKRGNIEIII